MSEADVRELMVEVIYGDGRKTVKPASTSGYILRRGKQVDVYRSQFKPGDLVCGCPDCDGIVELVSVASVRFI